MRRVVPLLLVLAVTVGAGAAGGSSFSGAWPIAAARIAPCPVYDVFGGDIRLVSSAHPTMLSLDCESQAQFIVLDHLVWHGWGQPLAGATGVLSFNRCDAVTGCLSSRTKRLTATIYVSKLTHTTLYGTLYQQLTIVAPPAYQGPRSFRMAPSNTDNVPTGE